MNAFRFCRYLVLISLVLFVSVVFGAQGDKEFTNSLGMKMIRIEPGSFVMGNEEIKSDQNYEYERPGWWVGGAKDPAIWDGVRSGLALAVITNSDSSPRCDMQQIDQVNIDYTTEQAINGRLRGSSTVFRGLIKSPVTGPVTFTLEAGGFAKLEVDHEVMAELQKSQTSGTGQAQLCKGKFASIAIDVPGTTIVRLYWSYEGQPKTLVPASAFSYSAADYNMAAAKAFWRQGRTVTVSGNSKGDYDEFPRRKVTITKPFYMAEKEVTIWQFRQFKAEYPGYDNYKPYASAITWDEAAAFCNWLSQKEGKPYRLPTEAEWEYACRAGTKTMYSSGHEPPEPETANPWGIKNMHTNVREWTLDWHGVYPPYDEVDPLGPEYGWVKVFRGGSADWSVRESPFYARSANRGAVSPNFGPPPLEYQFKELQSAKITYNFPKQLEGEVYGQYQIDRMDDVDVTLSEVLNMPYRFTGHAGQYSIRTSGMIPGRHAIGFRVVQAEMPDSKPREYEPPMVHRSVKQEPVLIDKGPDPERPYYRTRLLFPDLQRESLFKVGYKVGLEQGYGLGHHNSALAVLPNGDMLSFYYNTITSGERGADVSIMAMRFRRGGDEWDMPTGWPDFVDSDDEGPVIWNDNGILWLFWGSPRQYQGTPFQWMTSNDNGATWSPVQIPIFEKRVGPYAAQPINSAFRDSKGTIYLAVDGSHSPLASELFASKNNGKTWYDTGGRTFGRHSTFTILDDDTIMAFGGKQAEIDGFHPISISRDGGETYEIIPSTLPALGGGVRASFIKLASGRLFYVGDMDHRTYRKLTPEQCPPGYDGQGAYAALSDDLGKTWRVRKLWGGNVLGKDDKPVKVHTVSYVTARQSQDGMIHIVTSHNDPDLHFELNEAWILADPKENSYVGGESTVDLKAGTLKQYSETYPDGNIRVTYGAGIDQNGHFVLDGTETWYYQNGQKEWQIQFNAGRRVGTETYWADNGTRKWQKVYNSDGTYDWTVWTYDGKLQAKSKWQDKKLLSHKIYE